MKIAMTTRAKLLNENKIIIAEHLFFAKPKGRFNSIDLRVENVYTIFMAHNRVNEFAFISQFAKLKRIEFMKFDNKPEISFYKDKDQDFDCSEMFKGPWHVPSIILESIIKCKKLRVSTVKTINYFEEFTCPDLKILKNASPLNVFCALFCNNCKNGIDIEEDGEYAFLIDKLEMVERTADIQRNIEAIFALNPVELEIFTCLGGNPVMDCSSFPNIATAERIKTIHIKSSISFKECDLNVETWGGFVNFLLKTCPNLEKMDFEISGEFDDANSFSEKLHGFFNAIKEKTIGPLAGGKSGFRLGIQWTGNCDRLTYECFNDEHQLLKLGTPFTIENMEDEPYKARSIKTEDAQGRQHECVFKIFIDEPEVSSYGSLHDDLYEDYYGQEYYEQEEDDDYSDYEEDFH